MIHANWENSSTCELTEYLCECKLRKLSARVESICHMYWFEYRCCHSFQHICIKINSAGVSEQNVNGWERGNMNVYTRRRLHYEGYDVFDQSTVSYEQQALYSYTLLLDWLCNVLNIHYLDLHACPMHFNPTIIC